MIHDVGFTSDSGHPGWPLDVRFVPIADIGCTKRKTATRRPLRNLKQRLESTGAAAAFLYRFSRFGDRK
jgi:hypothetical protein